MLARLARSRRGVRVPAARLAHRRGLAVVSARSDADLKKLISGAGEAQLVVIDYTATWCPPCKMIAPVYEKMSEEKEGVLFLKADVDVCQESAVEANVSAVPTFHFVRDCAKIGEVQGADAGKLAELVEAHK